MGQGPIYSINMFTVAPEQKTEKRYDEPFFKLYAFMVLSDYNKLRNQERRLHLLNYDTINASHT